jgi:hypothetical protein
MGLTHFSLTEGQVLVDKSILNSSLEQNPLLDWPKGLQLYFFLF